MAAVVPLPTPSPNDRSGIGLAASAFALSTACDVVLKLLASGHPGYQLLAVNGLFALIPILICTFATGGPARLSTTKPLLHVIRACAGVLSAVAAIFAYSRVPLTDFYAIVFAGPLLVTVLSAVWLGEKVDRARWLAIGAGFIGILVMAQPFQAESATHPSTPTVMLGRAAALLSVFGYALSVIMVRRMHIGESSLTFSFFGYSVAIVGGLIISSVLNPPALTTGDIAHLALSGTFSGLGGLCLMEAYHRAPIAMVAPFQYTQIFWGALASFVLWHTVPSPTLIVGASIVAASGLFILYRNRRGKP